MVQLVWDLELHWALFRQDERYQLDQHILLETVVHEGLCGLTENTPEFEILFHFASILTDLR